MRRNSSTKKGHWGDPLHPTLFHECTAQACKGGEGFECASGHTGRMCKLCDEGYFSLGGDCLSCPPGALGSLVEVRGGG